MKSINIIIIIMLLWLGVSSQNNKKLLDEQKCGISGSPVRNVQSVNRNSVLNELSIKLKEARLSGNNIEAVSIQNKINDICGGVNTQVIPINTTVTLGGNSVPGTDNLEISSITNVQNIKAVTSSTEEMGTTIGRLWSVVAYDAALDHSAILLSYSDNNGTNWTNYLTISYTSGMMISNDEIDAEIFEKSTGDKFMWIVFGYKNGSIWRIGLTMINITNLNTNTIMMNWPGISSEDYYYKPRICTDNVFYTEAPYAYIVCNYDSVLSANSKYSGAKGVIGYSIYSSIPNILYKSSTVTGLIFNKYYPYNYDVVYSKNGYTDSVFVLECGLTDSSKLFLGKGSIVDFVSFSSLPGFYIQATPYSKTNGYITGCGSNNKMMLVYREKWSEQYWDIRYMRSTAGSGFWSIGYIDGRFVNKSRPDITAKRNSPGFFYCAYSTIDSYDSVFYASANNYLWNTPVGPKNHIGSSVTEAPPRPGYRLISNDACFSIWAGTGGNGVYSTVGCSPVTIGIKSVGNNIPDKIKLKQNYPNPFNPITKIQFDVTPEASSSGRKVIQLSIYNSNGQLVKNLINEQLPPGEYEILFDGSAYVSGIYFCTLIAGNYSETKKMIMIK